ncbi:MAG: hypothetical protein GEU75_03145 [Dehalococcoidia bacterium]|nr:hypothetical protein [Dehalococcoidia bacterium]
MKPILLAVSLFTAVAGLVTIESARPAYACSAGDDFNPVSSSEVIVMGTITGWQPVTAPANIPTHSTFQTVEVTISVDRTLKGTPVSSLVAVDTSSLIREGQGPAGAWVGSSGACGAFNADPTGMYVLMGLSRTDGGALRTHLLHTFYIGEKDQLSGPRYERIRERLAAYGLTTLPALGSGGDLRDDDNLNQRQLAGAGLVGIAILTLGLSWAARIRRST